VVHRLLNAEQAIGGMTPKAFAVNMTTLLGCGRARRTRWPRSPRLGALSSKKFGLSIRKLPISHSHCFSLVIRLFGPLKFVDRSKNSVDPPSNEFLT